MIIEIEALDTLFFRDGKPFSREEESWADGIFPPPPSVFYGALRTLFFSMNPDKVHLANKENDPTKELIIHNIILSHNEELHYPCPADLVADKEDEDILFLQLTSTTTVSSNKLNSYLLKPFDQEKNVEPLQGRSYLSDIDFKDDYITGVVPVAVAPLGEVIQEPKVGIGRDNQTAVASEGMLYRVGMLRTATEDNTKMKFIVSFTLDGFDLANKSEGFLKLGAENKVASYKVVGDEAIPSQFPELTDKYFKIVLLTPTIFENGWYPDFLNENYIGEWNGQSVKMLAASIGKPKSFGGFDIKKGKPKQMLKAVPEGSVFFFEKLNDGQGFSSTNQSFKLGKRTKEGFGVAYLANTLENQIKL